MGNQFRFVQITALGLGAALALTSCKGLIRSVTDPIGKGLGNAISTGLACGLNGAVAGAEEGLTVDIPASSFEAMRVRLRSLPDQPNVDQNRGVFTAAEESLLGDAILNAKYDVGSTKASRLLTLPQTEDLVFRALVAVAKSPERAANWSFKRIALAKSTEVKKLDPQVTVVRLTIRLADAGGQGTASQAKLTIFCD